MSSISNVSISEVFSRCGIDYKDMDELSEVDVSDKNIKIMGYDEQKNKNDFYKVTRLVRKKDTKMYTIEYSGISHPLKVTNEHKFLTLDGYLKVENLPNKFKVLKDDGNYVEVRKSQLNEKYPVLDITVDKVKNYYTNGILSHNSPETVSGGKALAFWSSIRLEVRKADYIKEGENIIGIKTRVKGVKNKTAPPFRKAEVDIVFGKGLQYEAEYVDHATKYEFIEKSASWFNLYNSEGTFLEKLQGKDRVVEYFKNNPEYFQQLKDKVNQAIEKENGQEEDMDEQFETEASENSTD